MEYSAFISYRRSDGAATAEWLRNALRSFKLPKSMRGKYTVAGIEVFLDTA